MQQRWLDQYGSALHQKNKVKDLGLDLLVELANEKVRHFVGQLDPSGGAWQIPGKDCTKIMAVLRYIEFLNLYKINKEEILYPTFDIELVWFTHQLQNSSYLTTADALQETKFESNYFMLGPKTRVRKQRDTATAWKSAFKKPMESDGHLQSFIEVQVIQKCSINTNLSTINEVASVLSRASSVDSIKTSGRHRRSSYDDLPDNDILINYDVSGVFPDPYDEHSDSLHEDQIDQEQDSALSID
ncbi:MAG: glycine-rich domain-containing protein-like [Oligoflexales bacterium]|nr:glycine-rich domain-containing protein-like [Oligoflexales bacterium]